MGAFNDVTYGSIFSTFYEGGPYTTYTNTGTPITISATDQPKFSNSR